VGYAIANILWTLAIPTYVGDTGKRYRCVPEDVLAIPSYVGDTSALIAGNLCETCHPHLRGGYSLIHPDPDAIDLPSPLTWGVLAYCPH